MVIGNWQLTFLIVVSGKAIFFLILVTGFKKGALFVAGRHTGFSVTKLSYLVPGKSFVMWVLCANSPGVRGTSNYPCFPNRSFNKLFANMPA